MTISTDELPARREELESNIKEKVSDLILEFHSDTGLPVSHVDIQLADVTHLGGSKDFVVSRVEVTVAV